MTIGDVLAVTAGILALGTAWTATLLLFALAFPARTVTAQLRLTTMPGICLARGVGVVLVSALLAILCWNAAGGAVKLLGGIIAGGVGIAAALGSAGAVRLLGTRIDAVGTSMTPFGSLTRASLLYVVAGFLPVLGWFLILPGALLLSVGAGVSALLPARAQPSLKPREIEAVA